MPHLAGLRGDRRVAVTVIVVAEGAVEVVSFHEAEVVTTVAGAEGVV
jgi:hypothetical protein